MVSRTKAIMTDLWRILRRERGSAGSAAAREADPARGRRPPPRLPRRAAAARDLRALGAFSFFSQQNLPIGEGGMFVTDDDDLAAPLAVPLARKSPALT